MPLDVLTTQNELQRSLKVAIETGEAETVAQLLQAGADPNFEDEEGGVPLLYAIDSFNPKTSDSLKKIAYLIEADADFIQTVKEIDSILFKKYI